MTIILAILKWIVRIWCIFCGACSAFLAIGRITKNAEITKCECGGTRIKAKSVWGYIW